jgi:hypothetical protein
MKPALSENGMVAGAACAKRVAREFGDAQLAVLVGAELARTVVQRRLGAADHAVDVEFVARW